MPSPFFRRAACAALNAAMLTVIETPLSAQQPAAPDSATSAATGGDAVVPLPSIDVESPAETSLISAPLTSTSLTPQQVGDWRLKTDDTARMLLSVPGTSVIQAGGVSGLPVIHGLADDRVNTVVDGMPLPSACGNHMNPPLSYLAPSSVGDFTAIAGITPVSKGGDSIAGTVTVNSPAPLFAAPGESLRFTGETQGYYRSNSDNYATSIGTTVANDTYSMNYNGSFTTAGNYSGGGSDGTLHSTEYRAFNQLVTAAARGDNDLATLQFGQQYIPYQGFPNQWMDMTENRSYIGNAAYERSFEWGQLTARAFVQSVDHTMNFLDDKGGNETGGMPMNVDAWNAGYRLAATIPLNQRDTINVGSEYYYNWLNDRWPAVPGSMMMGPDEYISINDGTRNRLGTFAEWEAKWTPQWSSLLGVRNDTVWMDTGDVQAYDSMPSMMNPDAEAAAAFNARSHGRTDVNFDWTILGRFTADENQIYELGYARKTRSPNFYERYAWGTGQMASQMIGWFGDGNGYVGDISLKPEVAHTVSATADWHGGGAAPWQVKVTPYYMYVENYIGVERIQDFTDMAGQPSGFVQLQFANHNAQFYGVDLSASTEIWESDDIGRFNLAGTLGWVRGRDLTTNTNAYEQMPLNSRLTLSHDLGAWASAIEIVVAAEKSKVDNTRNELRTDEYALLNLRTSYGIGPARLYFAIDNVFDTAYDLPLGGVAVSELAFNGGQRQQVWGVGRSFITGLKLQW
ncbi:MAG: TonB-dependent receptor plug domain-containing protein [Rhodospirillales bacterium]